MALFSGAGGYRCVDDDGFYRADAYCGSSLYTCPANTKCLEIVNTKLDTI